jgi:hypothetical protein
MPTFEVTSIIVLGALAWLWYDSLKARDVGIRAARAACESENYQLLDDTVAIASLRLGRSDNGRVLLRRVYDFEFSDTGDNRRHGSIVLLGHRVIVVNIGLRLVASERTLH